MYLSNLSLVACQVIIVRMVQKLGCYPWSESLHVQNSSPWDHVLPQALRCTRNLVAWTTVRCICLCALHRICLIHCRGRIHHPAVRPAEYRPTQFVEGVGWGEATRTSEDNFHAHVNRPSRNFIECYATRPPFTRIISVQTYSNFTHATGYFEIFHAFQTICYFAIPN